MTRRALTYDDLYRLREAADPRLSPDRATVAFVLTSADRVDDENRSQIWVVGTDGGDARPFTHGTADAAPRWSPDGRYLAFLRRDKDTPAQLWLLPATGGEARKLTDLPLGASGLAWAPDSSRLAVLGPVDLQGEPDDEKEKERRGTAPVVVRTGAYKADGVGLIGTKRVHLFVADVDTGGISQITKNDLNVLTPAWSPDGDQIAFAGSTSDRDVSGRTHLFVVGAGGGEPEEIAHWEGTAVCPAWSPGGETLLFVGQERPRAGHNRLFTVDAAGGTPAELVPGFDRNVMVGAPAYPGAPPAFLEDGGVIFSARDRGCTHLYAARDGKAEKIVGGDDRVLSGANVASDLVAYAVSAPQIPADLFVAGTDGSGERRITDLNRELLDEVRLHEAGPRTFTAPDGTQIHGWVTKGDGPGPRPLLVDIHGGPHNAWNPAFDAVHLYHEVLASQGWTILRINPRGSDGYGEDFFTAVVASWGQADEDDFLSAVDTLVTEGTADPERLAVCGYSYGGHMTNWLTAHTDRFKAAVSGGCVSNLVSFYGNSDFGYWLGVFEMGAELHEARDRFDDLSPLTYVSNVTTPTLILHGENDDRCPIGQAEEWFVSLRRLGREVEFVRYPGASHLFILNGRPSHRLDYNQRIIDWITEHAKG